MSLKSMCQARLLNLRSDLLIQAILKYLSPNVFSYPFTSISCILSSLWFWFSLRRSCSLLRVIIHSVFNPKRFLMYSRFWWRQIRIFLIFMVKRKIVYDILSFQFVDRDSLRDSYPICNDVICPCHLSISSSESHHESSSLRQNSKSRFWILTSHYRVLSLWIFPLIFARASSSTDRWLSFSATHLRRIFFKKLRYESNTSEVVRFFCVTSLRAPTFSLLHLSREILILCIKIRYVNQVELTGSRDKVILDDIRRPHDYVYRNRPTSDSHRLTSVRT